MDMSKGKLIKNYLYNTIYQVLVLIAPLITTPYVSRVLGVTNIGIYQYAQSIAAYFVLVGAVGTSLYGQREIAYLQDKPFERSVAFWEIEIFRLVTAFVCVLIYLCLFCLRGTYSNIYAILSLEVLATAFDISWLYMGMENFSVIVIRNIIIKVTGIICVFIFVKTSNDLYIYTICVTVPLFLGNISLWFSLKKYVKKSVISISKLASGIKKRIKPILILFLPQVAADVYLLLDKTMIGILGTNIDQVGYYSQAQKVVKIVLMIVTSLGTVMLPTMAALYAKGDNEGIKRNIKQAFRFIYMLSFPLMFGLCAIAPRFVPAFFGEGYEPVVQLMILVSPIIVIIATSNVIGKQYLLPTNQQKSYTISIILGATVNFFLNILLIRFWNAIGASVATIAAEITVTVIQCKYVKKELPILTCIASGTRYFVFGLIMFVTCRGISCILPEDKVWAIIVVIFVGFIFYFLELLITKDDMLKRGIMIIKKHHNNE